MKIHQMKNKSWDSCSLTDHLKSIQTEDSEWTLNQWQEEEHEEMYIGNIQAPADLLGVYMFGYPNSL